MDIEIEEQTEQEMSYQDILDTLASVGEIIITIPQEMEIQTKTGLKNLKAKIANRLRAEGQNPPDEVLEFYSSPSKEYEDCVRLHIVLKKRGSITVKKLEIPEDY